MRAFSYVRVVQVGHVELLQLQSFVDKKGSFGIQSMGPIRYEFQIDDEWPFDFWRPRENKFVVLSGEYEYDEESEPGGDVEPEAMSNRQCPRLRISTVVDVSDR